MRRVSVWTWRGGEGREEREGEQVGGYWRGAWRRSRWRVSLPCLG